MGDVELKEKIKKIQETLNQKEEYSNYTQIDTREKKEVNQNKVSEKRGKIGDDIRKIITFFIFLAFLKLLAILF